MQTSLVKHPDDPRPDPYMLKRLNRMLRITRVEQIHIYTMYVTLFITLLFSVWVMTRL